MKLSECGGGGGVQERNVDTQIFFFFAKINEAVIKSICMTTPVAKIE